MSDLNNPGNELNTPETEAQNISKYQLTKVLAENDLDAIREGYLQAQAGEGKSIEQFFAEFEAKHDLKSS